jgi:hypothetical protein
VKKLAKCSGILDIGKPAIFTAMENVSERDLNVDFNNAVKQN